MSNDLALELTLMWALWPPELSWVVAFTVLFAVLGYLAYRVNVKRQAMLSAINDYYLNRKEG